MSNNQQTKTRPKSFKKCQKIVCNNKPKISKNKKPGQQKISIIMLGTKLNSGIQAVAPKISSILLDFCYLVFLQTFFFFLQIFLRLTVTKIITFFHKSRHLVYYV